MVLSRQGRRRRSACATFCGPNAALLVEDAAMAIVDDAELVQAALRGDQSAFDTLAARYRGAAYGIAFDKLGDFETARDAAQEALVKAYVELHTLRAPSKFGGWFCRIATTTALGFRRKRRALISLDSLGEMIPAVTTTPAEVVEQMEKARQVREALGLLRTTDRTALTLHYAGGYSHEEIGAILRVSASAIKARIHRARRLLRGEMQAMAEHSLRESAPDRFDLRPLKHFVWYGFCGREYRERLRITVTHVFGRSETVMAGDSFVVRGRYTLRSPEDIRLRLVVDGTSTAYVPSLRPGSGKFELQCKAHKLNPGAGRCLQILMPDDRSWIQIELGRELRLKPLRYSTRRGRIDKRYADILKIAVSEVQGTSAEVRPGESYSVRGNYDLAGSEPVEIRLAAVGVSEGFAAAIPPGVSDFELLAHVRRVEPGMERVLSILTPDDKAHVCIRLRTDWK